MDLAEFLRARLDGDEAGVWAVHDVAKCDALLYEEELAEAAGRGVCDCGWPARLRREIAAKRAILDLYEAASEHDDTSLGVATLRTVVRTFAKVYSGHPDYQAIT